MKVLFAGSFDPVTKGHLDLIERASALYDELVVAVMVNESKSGTFDTETRVAFIRNNTNHLMNCSVVSSQGLTVSLAQELGCTALLRGVRTGADYEYESVQASINKALDPSIETIFMIASQEKSIISSSAAKAIAQYGGSLEPFVTKDVEIALREHMLRMRTE